MPAAPEPIFVDRAREWGLDFVHFNGMSGEYYYPEMIGAGGALVDYDGDGDLDVYLVQGAMLGPGKTLADATVEPQGPLPPADRLFRNDGVRRPDGTLVPHFVDVTAESRIAATGYGMGVATGDFDNDGRPDLYVANFGPNQLWHNDGKTGTAEGAGGAGGARGSDTVTFTDVTARAGADDPRWSVGAVVFDFDRDGWLDLFVVNYLDFDLAKNPRCFAESSRRDYCGPAAFKGVPDRLLRNRGDGTFEDVSVRSGIGAKAGPGLGAVAADFDGDGWPDLYVANDGAENFLWLNNHDGTFRDEALFAGAALNRDGKAEAGMGVDAGDFDDDGDFDLFLAHLTGETNTLYVNAGGAVFSDRSVESGLAAPSLPFTSFGTGWFDYDGDGWLDLVALNGAVRILEAQARAGDPYPLKQTNQLFHNLGPVAGAPAGQVRFAEVTGRRRRRFPARRGQPRRRLRRRRRRRRRRSAGAQQRRPRPAAGQPGGRSESLAGTAPGRPRRPRPAGSDRRGAARRRPHPPSPRPHRRWLRLGQRPPRARRAGRRAAGDGAAGALARRHGRAVRRAAAPRLHHPPPGDGTPRGEREMTIQPTQPRRPSRRRTPRSPTGLALVLAALAVGISGAADDDTQRPTGAPEHAAAPTPAPAAPAPAAPGAEAPAPATSAETPPPAGPTPAEAPAAALTAIPFPDLSQLEPAVAHQLADVQEALRGQLGAEGASGADRAAAFGLLGQLYQAYGFDESAEVCYRNAEALVAGDFRWPYYLGTVYQAAGYLDEAADAYRRALPLYPGSVSARVHLAEVEIARNRAGYAQPLLEQVLAVAPDCAAAEAGLGQIALAAGRYQEAVERLERALAEVPGANRLEYPLAMAYRGLGDDEQARAHLARRGMVGVRPPDPLLDEVEGLKQGERVRLIRGQVAFRAGRYAEAAEAFRAALEAEPDSVRARVNLGAALAQTGDREGAVAQLRAALERDGDNFTAHLNLGSLLLEGGEVAEATKQLAAAVDLAPDDGGVHRLLADALRRGGRPAEAVPHYAAAARLAPQDESTRVEGAATLVDLGRYQEARRVLEAARAALPTSGLVAHALARLLAACPDATLRDGERALDLAQRVYAASSTPAHAETLAMAFAQVGRCGEAAKVQRQVVDDAAAQGDGDRRAGPAAVLAAYEKGPPCAPPSSP